MIDKIKEKWNKFIWDIILNILGSRFFVKFHIIIIILMFFLQIIM